MFDIAERSAELYSAPMGQGVDATARALLTDVCAALRTRGIRLTASFVGAGATAAVEVDGDVVGERSLVIGGTGQKLPPPEPDVLYVVPAMGAADAEALRAVGAWFADGRGDVYVRAPRVLVDVRGGTRSRRAATEGVRDRASRPSNLMSARRAQVVACLLIWPELVGASVRAIAGSASVSVATTQDALGGLVDEGFLTRDRRVLMNREQLVDRWADAFPTGLGRALELGRFEGAPVPDVWSDLGHDVDMSGLAVSPDLRGEDLVLYVPRLDVEAVLRSRWRKGPSSNIVLRRRFYRPPDSGGLFEGVPVVGTAPSLLVYGDLLASGEPRQRAVAREMRSSLA